MTRQRMKKVDARDLVLPRIAEMAGYTPGEQPADESRLVKLNTNENPYAPAPCVSDAVRDAASQLHLYPEPMADSLRQAAAARYGVRAENILVGNGSDELLAIVLRACAGSEGCVAYGVPTYSLYRTLAAIVGADVVEFPIECDGEVAGGLASEKADVSFLCTPNSPFGSTLGFDAVEAVLGEATGVVVVDEAYGDFGGRTALPLIERWENLIVTRSFSKSFSLAGARLGLAFGAPGLMAQLAKVKDSYNISRLSLAAGLAALDDYAWMEANVARVVTTRTRVIAALADRGWTTRPTEANFFWMDCSGRGGGAQVYARLREAGVLVRYFDLPGLDQGVRVTVGTDEQMDRFLDALSTV
jgi:histidinol-phosphate aminotransferase